MAVNQSAIATQLQASLATINAALATIGSLATATPFALAPVAAAVTSEIATLEAAIDELDADMVTDSVAGVVSGQPSPVIWPVLLNQGSDSAQISTLMNALGYLQRLASNLSQVNVAVPVTIPSPPRAAPSLDFSDPGNSQFLPAL